VQAVDAIKRKAFLALWFDMRQGKTVSTLTAVQDLYEDFEAQKILVVAPLRVTVNSWPEDLRDWEHISLGYQLVRGTPTERKHQLKSQAPVHLINREMLPWLVATLGKDNWPYDTVVLDESRSYKNHAPKTPVGNLTRFGALRAVRPKIDRLIELTGTPAPKNYMDLWAQIFLLDGGKRLGKNISAFREEYCVQGREHYQWKLRGGAEADIETAIEDIVFRVAGTEIPELPAMDIKVRMPNAARQVYNDMLNHGIVELNGEDIVALDAAARVNKCAQISSGHVYDSNKKAHLVHTEKLDALDELLELIDDNVLIVYNFQFEKDALLAKYKDVTVLDSDPNTVKRWNAGLIPKLLLHPASGGHGLNLYRGGNTIIWMSPTWDNELYRQVNKRLSIHDKPVPTQVYRIIEQSGTDASVIESLTSKEQGQQALLKRMQQAQN
jgi:SNF2 family DNA or RNA helicase